MEEREVETNGAATKVERCCGVVLLGWRGGRGGTGVMGKEGQGRGEWGGEKR